MAIHPAHTLHATRLHDRPLELPAVAAFHQPVMRPFHWTVTPTAAECKGISWLPALYQLAYKGSYPASLKISQKVMFARSLVPSNVAAAEIAWPAEVYSVVAGSVGPGASTTNPS